MGLLLSVLVACVGVVELIAFYHNVKRNITSPPVRAPLSRITERYRKELHGVEHRLDEDLHAFQSASSGIPTFTVNSREDIVIEYDEQLLRSRSPSPRTFLVTEKDSQEKDRDSSRRFVVSDEPQAIKKTKSQNSMPEFLIHEQKNSPNKPRYVLSEQQDESSHPNPLPRQFIVTEDELNTVIFDETCRPNQNQDKDRYRRSPSPYPPLQLPHVPRNSICSDLLENPTFSVVEYDEEDESISPTPGKVDMILESTNFNTTQFWTNKVLVSPSKHSKFKAHPHKKHLTTYERTRSKSESENNDAVGSVPDNKAASDLELNRKADEDSRPYDEDYLNSLDGVNKAKLKCTSSKRAFNRRKNASNNSFEKPKSSIAENSNENTGKTLSEAAEELKKISEHDTSSKEPFWVKN